MFDEPKDESDGIPDEPDNSFAEPISYMSSDDEDNTETVYFSFYSLFL
jgi:hypothetical protein